MYSFIIHIYKLAESFENLFFKREKLKEIEEIDMTYGIQEGQNMPNLDWYKMWIMGDTNNQLVQKKCLIEGKASYESLRNHVILMQINVKDNDDKKSSIIEYEQTPFGSDVHYLIPKHLLLGNNILWRYMSLSKFEDIINNKHLHYSRLDQFKDNLEGQAPFACKRAIALSPFSREQKLINLRLYKKRMLNNRQQSFACCWHINDKINHSLWKEYGSDNVESICIRTSVNKLESELQKTKLPFINEPVQYFKEPYFNQNAYWFPALFKRDSYNHEKEYRSIVSIPGFDINYGKIKVNPEKIISKIYLHPNASKEFCLKIKTLIKTKNMSIPVVIAPKSKTFC